MKMNNMGYGFIIDKSGLIIAHHDQLEKGKIYPVNKEQEELLHQIYNEKKENFEMKINGENCTVFANQVMDEWYVIMVVSNTKLFHE